MKTAVALTASIALTLCVGIAPSYGQYQQGGSQGGGFGGGGMGGGGTSGSSSAPISRSTTSLFPGSTSSGSSTSGSNSSLFPGSTSSMTSTSTSSGNYGSSTSSGSSGAPSVSSGDPSVAQINTGTIGAGNTPLARNQVISRDTGSAITNSNYDLIGGQALSGNNQFANLISQMGRQINQGGNFNQQGGRNTVRPTIRVPMRLGFVSRPVQPTEFKARFEGRIANLSGISSIGPIRISMDGSTAILRGVVPSLADKDLAEGVALLEPEVEYVQNDLVVQAPAANSDELTPPPPKATP